MSDTDNTESESTEESGGEASQVTEQPVPDVTTGDVEGDVNIEAPAPAPDDE